jgi:hypothetical protein
MMHGGAGIDTADFSFAVGGATVSLDNQTNDFVPSRFLQDNLLGNVFDDVENLIGAANGSNTLIGSDDDNVFTLHGLAPSRVDALGGNDIIIGNRSIDSTDGDTIDGGSGIDACEEDPDDSITNVETFFAPGGGGDARGASHAMTHGKPPAAGIVLVAREAQRVWIERGAKRRPFASRRTSAGISVVRSARLDAKSLFAGVEREDTSLIQRRRRGTDQVFRSKSE